MEYSNVEDLISAYESGEIDGTNPVIIDNDSVIVFAPDMVFDGGPPRVVLSELLDYLEIPNENA